MRASTLKPRKTPRQDRSAAMVALILQAATRVLERESLVGFNTNRVAAVAGISVGSLYQYFPNKEALMAALIAQDQQARVAAIESTFAAINTLPLADAVEALAHYAVQQQFGRPLLAAALDHEERRLPVKALLRAADARIERCVAVWLAQHRDAFAGTLPEQAAQDCLTITRALVEASIETGALPAANLPARVARALLGYLGVLR